MRKGALPIELEEFLSKSGNVLAVKGSAGTGKTTFGLDLIDCLDDPSSGMYISTRVSELKLARQFPWMNERWKDRMMYLSSISNKENMILESARFFGEPKKQLANVSSISENISTKALVVIDSIQGLGKRLNVSADEMIDRFSQDVLPGARANLVVISESAEEDKLDYLCDGLVTLKMEPFNGRIFRKMVISKLRGTRISHPEHTFSLEGGKFVFVNPVQHWFEVPSDVKDKKCPIPIATEEGKVSLGNPSIDALLEGGVRPGTYVMFVVDRAVPNSIIHHLKIPFIVDGLNKGHAAIVIPALSTTAEDVHGFLLNCVEKEIVDSHTRLLSENAGLDSKSKKYLIIVEPQCTSNEDNAKVSEAEQEMRNLTKKPLYRAIGIDYEDAKYANEHTQLVKNIASNIATGHRLGDVTVSFLREGMELVQRLSAIVDVILYVRSLDGTIALYGEKPSTGLYSIKPDYSAGVPRVELRAIV